MNKTRIFFLMVCWTAGLSLFAEKFTVQADTWLRKDDKNYGASTGLGLTAKDGVGAPRYAMFRFDINGIDTASLTNAVLYVKNANKAAGPQKLYVSAVYPSGDNSSWKEGTLTGQFNASASSWYWAEKINVPSKKNRWSRMNGTPAADIEDGVLAGIADSPLQINYIMWGETVAIPLSESKIGQFTDSNGLITLILGTDAPQAGAVIVFSKEHPQGDTYLELQGR